MNVGIKQSARSQAHGLTREADRLAHQNTV
jgi:hypothetical protein